MQFLKVDYDLTLSELSDRIGSGNVDNTLNLNDLTRTPKLGQVMQEREEECYQSGSDVTYQQKATILNKYVGYKDIFETAALLDESSWKVLSTYGSFPGMLAIPETVELPDAEDILGDNTSIGTTVYNKAIELLYSDTHQIDPGIFNEYSNIKNVQIDSTATSIIDAMSWFPIPWGEITLYSDLTGESVDFPVYPEEISDGRKASYDTMPDLLYNFEPWYVFNTSGPREIDLTFKFHRDMWGSHLDGGANNLIRFCEAACYAMYEGSAVYTDMMSLYIKGSLFIHGIITNVQKDFSGPLGQDGMPLYVELKVSFTEVSTESLSYDVIRNKGIIG